MNVLKPAFDVLRRFHQSPAGNLKLILSHLLDGEPPASHPGITRAVYGVVREQRRLDFLVERLSNRNIKKLEPDILILLRIGCYLLVFSRGYPDYAVVNEAVQLAAKKTNGRAKGLVNAILRRCTREKGEIPALLDGIEDPTVRYSMAPLPVRHLEALCENDRERRDEALAYLNKEPVFHLRANTKDFPAETVHTLLGDDAAEIEALRPFFSFEVSGHVARVRKLVREGKSCYFQNAASQLVAMIAARFAGENVLDCCAAPGTKSVTLSILRPDLKIYANDINGKRIGLLQGFCKRFGIRNVTATIADIRRLDLEDDVNMDFLILDAPCTSAGTLRKNPDLKLKISEASVIRNADVQLEILRAVTKKYPGASVLYSVCSFIKDETDDVIEKFLADGVGETTDLSGILEEYGFRFKKGRHGFYLLPDPVLNNDLFYLSLIAFGDQNPF